MSRSQTFRHAIAASLALALAHGALLAVAAAPPQDAEAQDRQSGRSARTQTEQTTTVQKGARLVIDDCMGDVTIRTWTRSEVRVAATHPARERISVTQRGQTVAVETDANRGSDADYTVTAPAWIDVRIEGTSCSVDADGIAGSMAIETVEGDIVLRNVTGSVTASSFDGDVTIDGSQGRVEATSADGDIVLMRAGGEVVAETIDGDIRLTEVTSAAVEASTVDGDITYAGTLAAAGRYRFTTHDGDVFMTIPETSSVTFTVRTFETRAIDSTLPIKRTSESGRNRRLVYVLGTGAADVAIETFEGEVHLRKPGETFRSR